MTKRAKTLPWPLLSTGKPVAVAILGLPRGAKATYNGKPMKGGLIILRKPRRKPRAVGEKAGEK